MQHRKLINSLNFDVKFCVCVHIGIFLRRGAIAFIEISEKVLDLSYLKLRATEVEERFKRLLTAGSISYSGSFLCSISIFFYYKFFTISNFWKIPQKKPPSK
jgi:hypothetical protein